MLDQVLTLFELHADYDLDIMTENQTLLQVGAAVFDRLGPVLNKEQPDWVVVQGDTTSAALAALASFYCGCKVAHVEAGLRTRDKWRPFPEVINRRVVGVAADLHLAPTVSARDNLLREGISPESILVTGNPVIDALQWASRQPPSDRISRLLRQCGMASKQRLLLVTAHRRENFGAPLQRICSALREIAARYQGQVQIVYSVHPNPNVRRVAEEELGQTAGIHLVEALNYVDVVQLMKSAEIVLTDSGGIQEEAPSLGKPVLVLRDVTERPEAVTAGTVKLVGSNRERIVGEAVRLLESSAAYQQMAEAVNPYGDGLASHRIVSALLGEPFEPFHAAPPRGAQVRQPVSV